MFHLKFDASGRSFVDIDEALITAAIAKQFGGDSVFFLIVKIGQLAGGVVVKFLLVGYFPAAGLFGLP